MTYEQTLEDKMRNLYSEWLMEKFPEDIRCKDDLIELEENQTYAESFIEWAQKNI